MAPFNLSFIFGVALLAYFSSFIVFAVIRVLTGISIQRIGYLSLRRLAYTPRDGVLIEIRGFGINLHRPTFAQPTWMSVVLTELAVTVDLKALEGGRDSKRAEVLNGSSGNKGLGIHGNEKDATAQKRSRSRQKSSEPPRSKSWQHLTNVKNKIKRLHRRIDYIRWVDLVANNSSVTVSDVGTVQVGNFTMAVDTRRKMVDRRRMFSGHKSDQSDKRPAEWMFTVRSVLFTPDGRDSIEILDNATLNVHGLLYNELDGLRDASISLKLGRVQIPVDDISLCASRFMDLQRTYRRREHSDEGLEDFSISEMMEELDRPGSSHEEALVQTVSDSKEFVSSILRGIKEVQFAVSYVGMTKMVHSVRPAGTPIYLNASMKEIGVDLHRLDPKSAAHRMYFPPKTIAHQALVAALSIALGVDDGQGRPERLAYIPMATTTIRTTLPSKTVETVEDGSTDERNTNVLFANVVITSPSVDLDPKHLPLVLALASPKPRARKEAPSGGRHVLISRLLPKATVKLSMHEPVVRVALPAVDPDAEADDFDLLISSISSVSLDLESSHTESGELNYGLASTLRVQSNDLYYQTSSNSRFDLLEIESLEVKVNVTAEPEVRVGVSANLQTFSIHMIRPEISEGVRQIVRQLRTNVEPDKKAHPRTVRDPNFIRALPAWLVHLQFQGSDFSAEVAGVDAEISEETRGVALQLESWTAEYRAHRLEPVERKHSRRRTGSRSLTPDTVMLKSLPPSPRMRHNHPTDGRRLAVHVRGLEAFVVESAEKWEVDPFVSIPRFEVAVSTLTDQQGPVFHVHSHVRTLLFQYSLYRHYACGVAATVLKQAFVRTQADQTEADRVRAKAAQRPSFHNYLSPVSSPRDYYYEEAPDYPFATKELVTIDIKASLVQIKAQMPSDPPMMLQIYGMEAGRHRWSGPFLHAKLVRLYAEAPRMRHVWARLLSIKTLRVHLRETRRKLANGDLKEEKMVDVGSEAIRIAVPHQLVFHKISDNITNTMKAVQQLHHRFQTGTNEYILEKRPEGPKSLHKISIRSRALLFEVEDGAFEWKLGVIYKTGLVEQQQRQAREEAFQVKVRKIAEEQKGRAASRHRNRSAHQSARGRPNGAKSNMNRARSDDRVTKNRDRSPSEVRGRRYRYDPEGACGISGTTKVSVEDARQRLLILNAQSWKKAIDHQYAAQKNAMHDLRGVFWGPDRVPEEMGELENILEVPQRPALMGTLISDLHIVIDKPSFPISQLPDFMHRVGKGMPRDMQYSQLVPMYVQISMGEARMTLRDYPLPLLHVPALKPGQSPRLPAWSLKANFVVAEEFRGPESTRHVKVDIVPPNQLRHDGTSTGGGFAIDVRRTVSPVKTYSEIGVDINTDFPTRITWGASYQPAIQDMMMVFETFTKPQVDPSDRAGFWDKIRLGFHSRVNVAWTGDGAVHLVLKGTRDPYVVTGNGAGFLMCWRNDVRLSIHKDDDPKKFMTVDSGEYVLAIPDFSHQARVSQSVGSGDADSIASTDSYRQGALFRKVIMKLSGNVQWMAGLCFERDTDDGKRSFEFEPHYKVVLKEPRFTKAPPGKTYDAYRGFRSHHIHLSIAIKAPVDRDWSVTNTDPSRSYNTVHLTPRFFTHFFAWWQMFGGTMALPIRQGSLWPGVEKSSKKFGRHLSTIKYNLLLAPLFISHIYKHKDVEDYTENVTSATGIKVRLDSFMLDVHQRREFFNTTDKSKTSRGKASGMKMHQAQLDLLSADIRAVSATIAGATPEDLKRAASTSALLAQEDVQATDLSSFDIPDNDFSWIDMDDFVELGWILPSKGNPDTQIMPLAFAPRFTYFRQTDHGDHIDGDADRTSSFGNEPTHYCIMSKDDDPRRVQCDLIQDRLDQLEQQAAEHKQLLGEVEMNVIKDNGKTASLKQKLEQMKRHDDVLRDKKVFLESMLHRMALRVHTDDRRAVPDGDADRDSDGEVPRPKECDKDTEGIDSNPAKDFASDFSNRFVIHNMQMKWNNSLRNILLRYIHQVSQRRGFVYYLSRSAVRFILDIVDEQTKAKSNKADSPQQDSAPASPTTVSPDDHQDTQSVEGIIKDILADGKNTVTADDDESEQNVRVSADSLNSNIAEDFTPQNSYHLRLIAPQIQLQSEKNPKAVVLVTSKSMELKVVEVMDKERMFDDVSGLVQRRFSVDMDSTQFFVTQQKWFSSQLLSLYTGNHYGTPAGTAWPPWVPLEVMFDFRIDPFGFKRVVQKTSASLRYDKYNTLRLKYNDEVTGDKHPASPQDMESRMDHLWVEFPHIRAICDSAQYFAMYVIVLDLLLYSEPLEKVRNERLEKIMLASDFSDLSGAPEMVIRLQERIRQLDDIKTQFHIHSKHLDQQGWEDRVLLDQDIRSCQDELFFLMKAITTSQRKHDSAQSSGLIKWIISSEQIVWHLMRDKGEPLMEFQLQNAEYDRTDNSDGSHFNLMRIGKIVGLNLLPDAIYPEIIAPYVDGEKGVTSDANGDQMLRVYWYMLEAIAGIPVMDHFEVNLIPMRIQLEREVGQKLFEYIFPDSRDKPNGKEKNTSPFMVKNMMPVDDEDEEGDEASSATTPGANSIMTNSNFLSAADAERVDAVSNTRAGSLELRLRPTLTSETKATTTSSNYLKSSAHSERPFRLFNASASRSTSTGPPSVRVPSKKSSYESLRSKQSSRTGMKRSTTMTSLDQVGKQAQNDQKPARFNISKSGNKGKDAEKPSDDLSTMMTRASNYMTLAYVKIPSVVLCLSYKGKGERNIEDVHDFVFRLPTLEYRNKTWSNLDLAKALKKDVIRALVSHTGAIIGNKFSKHRPTTAQQTRLRELATSSVLLAPSSQEGSHDGSDHESNLTSSPVGSRRSERSKSKSPHRSITIASTSTGRARSPSVNSEQSSMLASSTASRKYSLSTNMMMTPARGERQGSVSGASHYPKSTRSGKSGKSGRSASGGQELDRGRLGEELARSRTNATNVSVAVTEGENENEGQGEGVMGGLLAHTVVGRKIGAKLAQRRNERESSVASGSSPLGDDEEATKKKSRLLLGKKILGGG